jgi:hypothetical protein
VQCSIFKIWGKQNTAALGGKSTDFANRRDKSLKEDTDNALL